MTIEMVYKGGLLIVKLKQSVFQFMSHWLLMENFKMHYIHILKYFKNVLDLTIPIYTLTFP